MPAAFQPVRGRQRKQNGRAASCISDSIISDRFANETIDLPLTGNLYGTNSTAMKNGRQQQSSLFDKVAFSSFKAGNQFNLEHGSTHYGTNSQVN